MSYLYQLTQQQLMLQEALLRDADDETGEAPEDLVEALERVEGSAERVIERMAEVYRELMVRHGGRRNEAERLANLAAQDKAAAESLKRQIYQYMTRTGRRKVQTERFGLEIRKNGGKLPIECDVDPVLLPPAYRRATGWKLNRDVVEQALARGETVPHVRYGERGEHLRGLTS